MYYYMLKDGNKKKKDDCSIHSVLDQDSITDRIDTEIRNKMLRLLLFTFVSR